jgi:hypothetical protein
VALLALAREDKRAAALLLAQLSHEELGYVAYWLALQLSERCGWSDATLRTWLLKQETAA